jgi:FixJ family two-component response regulator
MVIIIRKKNLMNIQPAHFYIMDDDQSFGRSLKRLLNVSGYSADYFGSARSFLDSIHPGQQGWAIVDIHMPECDGFTLIDKMHELHYDMPVIIITGQAQADARDLAMQKGAVGYLQKPFSPGSLLELIHKVGEK